MAAGQGFAKILTLEGRRRRYFTDAVCKGFWFLPAGFYVTGLVTGFVLSSNFASFSALSAS